MGRDSAGLLTAGPHISYARTSDGVSIAYASVGAGPALVLMPGVPFSNLAAEWRIPVLRRAFERMAATVRVVQYDGRGTGHSQRDVDDLSLDAMLRDLAAVTAALRLRRYALLGFYNSCTHAIAAAARDSDRVSGLVLFGGSTRGWNPMSGAGTQALLSLIDQDWDTFVESAAHAWLGWPDGDQGRLAAAWFRGATTPAVARATLRAASAIDVTAEAGMILCPSLVLHRADAAVIPLSMSEALVAAIPGARLEVVPGSSASLFFEQADRVADRLAAFARDPAGSPDPPGRPRGRGGGPAGLSPRETEVLRLLARGDSNAEIAGRLGLSIHTVERHVTNVYIKIDARGRAEATAFAVRNGLA